MLDHVHFTNKLTDWHGTASYLVGCDVIYFATWEEREIAEAAALHAAQEDEGRT